MQVTAEYAKDHLSDLLAASERGEVVQIRQTELFSVQFTPIRSPKPVLVNGKRVLGAGRGELRVPSDEEWRAMDLELEREMLEDPLTTNGER